MTNHFFKNFINPSIKIKKLINGGRGFESRPDFFMSKFPHNHSLRNILDVSYYFLNDYNYFSESHNFS